MGIGDRLRARKHERRRAWSQQVLGYAVDLIHAEEDTTLVSAVVDHDPEFVRIVYRTRWCPRPLGCRAHVPAHSRHEGARAIGEELRRIVCRPLEAQTDSLVADGGVEWWGDGYPSPGLRLPLVRGAHPSDVADDGGHNDDDADDGAFEAWSRWRERGLTPVTDLAAARWLERSAGPDHLNDRALTTLRHPGGPDLEIADLPAATLDTLCAVLSRHTTTPDACWMCVWDGYGWVHDTPGSFAPYLRDGQSTPPNPKPALPEPIRNGPRVTIEQFDYVLFAGAVTATPRMGWNPAPGAFLREWPNFVWPSDHAWLMKRGIDDNWLDLSGPHELIRELDTLTGFAVDRQP